MLRAVLPPLIVAYVIFVLMVVWTLRRPAVRPRGETAWLGPRRRGVIRYLAATTAGGYMVFLAIAAIFHTWLAAEGDALESALVEGALLALAVFTLFAVSAGLPRSRERGPP